MKERIMRVLNSRPNLFWKILIALGILTIGLWMMIFLDTPESRLTQQYSPKSVEYFYYLSKLYDDKGDFRKSQEAAQRAIEIDPDFGKAYIMLGKALMERGEFRRSIGIFQTARAKLQHDPVNLDNIDFNLGGVYWHERKPELSWDFLRKSLPGKAHFSPGLWSDSPRNNNYYVQRNDREGFRELYRQTYSGEGWWGWPSAVRSRHDEFYRDVECPWKHKKLLREYKEVFFRNNGSHYDYVYAAFFFTVLRKMGRWEEAGKVLRWMEKLPLQDSYREWVFQSQKRVLFLSAHADRALELVDRFEKDFPTLLEREDALLDKAHIYSTLGRYQEEREVLREVIKLCPNCEYARHAKGLMYKNLLYSARTQEASFWYLKMKKERGSHDLAAILVLIVGFLVGGVIFGGLFLLLSRAFFASKRKLPETNFLTWHAFGILGLWIFLSFFCYDLLGWMGFLINHLVSTPLFAEAWSLVIVAVIILFLWNKGYGLTMHDAGWKKERIFLSFALSLGAVCVPALIRYGYDLFSKGSWESPMLDTYLYALKMGIVSADWSTHLVFWMMTLLILPLCATIFLFMYFFNFIERWSNAFWAVLICAVVGIAGVFVHPLRGWGVFASIILLGIMYARSRLLWPCLAGSAAIVFFLVL